MNAVDLAYTAGLFDGEGCISFHRKTRKSGGHRYGLTVTVEMSDEESIDFLLSTFGGYKMFYDRVGKKRLYRWHVGALADVYKFLALIEPYVKYKRPQVETTLIYCEKMLTEKPVFTNAGYSEDIVEYQSRMYNVLREMKAVAGGMR